MKHLSALESSSRGIGLEIVRQLLQTPTNTVFATCRSPSTATELAALASSPGTLYIVQLDVADEASIKAGTDEVLKLLDGAGLDYVLNNAALKLRRGNDGAFTFEPTDLIDKIVTNTIGPALVTRHLLPAIERSDRRVIMNMSTKACSIASDRGRNHTSYCMNKIALNMLTYKQARERPDLIPIVMHPGKVRTNPENTYADIEPPESAAGILNVLQGLTKESAGKFIEYTGNEVPW